MLSPAYITLLLQENSYEKLFAQRWACAASGPRFFGTLGDVAYEKKFESDADDKWRIDLVLKTGVYSSVFRLNLASAAVSDNVDENEDR